MVKFLIEYVWSITVSETGNSIILSPRQKYILALMMFAPSKRISGQVFPLFRPRGGGHICRLSAFPSWLVNGSFYCCVVFEVINVSSEFFSAVTENRFHLTLSGRGGGRLRGPDDQTQSCQSETSYSMMPKLSDF